MSDFQSNIFDCHKIFGTKVTWWANLCVLNKWGYDIIMSAGMPDRLLYYKILSVTIKYQKKDQACLCFTFTIQPAFLATHWAKEFDHQITDLTKCPVIRDCYRTALKRCRTCSTCSPMLTYANKKRIVSAGNEITRTRNWASIFFSRQ